MVQLCSIWMMCDGVFQQVTHNLLFCKFGNIPNSVMTLFSETIILWTKKLLNISICFILNEIYYSMKQYFLKIWSDHKFEGPNFKPVKIFCFTVYWNANFIDPRKSKLKVVQNNTLPEFTVDWNK